MNDTNLFKGTEGYREPLMVWPADVRHWESNIWQLVRKKKKKKSFSVFCPPVYQKTRVCKNKIPENIDDFKDRLQRRLKTLWTLQIVWDLDHQASASFVNFFLHGFSGISLYLICFSRTEGFLLPEEAKQHQSIKGSSASFTTVVLLLFRWFIFFPF